MVEHDRYAKEKQLLLQELELLERELKTVGRINPENPLDWEATAGEVAETAEIESVAAEITDFEERSAIEFELEERLNDIKAALARIEDHTYGTCIVCKSPIEDARLKANPAATTCKTHMG